MDNQTQQTNNEPIADQKTEPKTFTQDDVNRIVQDRLAKERAKQGAELEQRAAELEAKEFNALKAETAKKHNIPLEVLDALKASNAEDLEKAVKVLTDWGNSPRALKPDGSPYTAEEMKHLRFTGKTGGGGLGASDPIKSAMGLK